jgi:hypothetical protein
MKTLFLVALCLPMFVRAQYCREYTSPNTGRINKTGAVPFSEERQPGSPIMTFFKEGDDYRIGCGVEIKATIKEVVAEKICLLAKFADGTIAKLPGSDHNSVSDDKPGLFILFLSSPINSEIMYFKKSRIVALGISLSGSEISDQDIKIDTAIAKRIEQVINCITD